MTRTLRRDVNTVFNVADHSGLIAAVNVVEYLRNLFLGKLRTICTVESTSQKWHAPWITTGGEWKRRSEEFEKTCKELIASGSKYLPVFRPAQNGTIE
jgi:hypothetical protein